MAVKVNRSTIQNVCELKSSLLQNLLQNINNKCSLFNWGLSHYSLSFSEKLYVVSGQVVVMLGKAGIELEPHQLLVDPKLNLSLSLFHSESQFPQINYRIILRVGWDFNVTHDTGYPPLPPEYSYTFSVSSLS